MTSSLRSRLRPSTSTGRGRAVDPEERFRQRVTLLFVALIVAVIAIVIIALVADYWTQHLKPVATVSGSTITRDQWSDRATLSFFRLDEEERDVRERIASGEVTPEDGNGQLQNIASAKQNVASDSIEELIDLAFKGKLAGDRGLSVTDADVDAAIADEATSPEARRISIIVVEPEAAGETSADELQAAYTKAQEAKAALDAGTPFEEVAREYSSDDSAADGGAYGYVTRDSSLDPAFIGTIFELEQGGVTPVIKGSDGVWRIGMVTEIRPGTVDAGLERRIRDTVGWDRFRNEVRKEALATKLEETVVEQQTTGDQEQVDLAEIFLEGDTELAPDEDEGTIHASHILFSPNDDPQAEALAEDDPAWTAAQQEAQAAADELRAITDVGARETRFVELTEDSDDPTPEGDLGFFTRATMVPEFSDPLFDDPDLLPGEIVGPVKSQFGWHVIQFHERVPGLQARLDAVTAALEAPDADFSHVAKELSEGAEAPAGGALGWLARPQLDPDAVDVVFALEPGIVSEPVPLGDGYHIYRVTEKATRPLDVQQRAVLAAGAFEDWYDPQKEAAEDDGTIDRDAEIFTNAPEVGG
jgi:parvulin-like peptidyl-prolyl isomerase